MNTLADMPSSWWTQAPDPTAPLSGECRADFAVIGGGFTGLGAALALRKQGLSVAVIERDFAGFGASGRNAGHLTPTIGKDLPTLLKIYGRERTRDFAGLAETAIRHVEDWIQAYDIACDYHPGGNILAAVHESQHGRLKRAAEAAESLGIHAAYLTSEDLRKRGIPEAFTGGVLEGIGGILDPVRFLLGLRRAALDAGATLFEQTPLTRIEEGPELRLHTPQGVVRADRAILATNAYTPELGRMGNVVLPALVSLFRTQPLTPDQRDRIDWRGREGIYTAHEMLENFRWTADGRILGGSKYIQIGYGGRVPPSTRKDTPDRLEAMFRTRFPELSDVAIESSWSGPVGVTLDFLPALGRTGENQNLYYATGYSGHGIALATYAGTALAEWIAGRDGPGRVLIDRRSLRLPPEPLRWLIAQGIAGVLSVLDRRADRRSRAARAGAKS